MNRNKIATATRTHIKSLMFFAMAGFLFTTGAIAADKSSAKKSLIEARDEWAQEFEVQCGLNDGIIKDRDRCTGAKENLVNAEHNLTKVKITFTPKAPALLKRLKEEGEESDDPKVLHKIIQELKAKNKALKAQASSQSCSAAGSLSANSVKKSSGLGHGSNLGEHAEEDADTVNFSSRSSKGSSFR